MLALFIVDCAKSRSPIWFNGRLRVPLVLLLSFPNNHGLRKIVRPTTKKKEQQRWLATFFSVFFVFVFYFSRVMITAAAAAAPFSRILQQPFLLSLWKLRWGRISNFFFPLPSDQKIGWMASSGVCNLELPPCEAVALDSKRMRKYPCQPRDHILLVHIPVSSYTPLMCKWCWTVKETQCLMEEVKLPQLRAPMSRAYNLAL